MKEIKLVKCQACNGELNVHDLNEEDGFVSCTYCKATMRIDLTNDNIAVADVIAKAMNHRVKMKQRKHLQEMEKMKKMEKRRIEAEKHKEELKKSRPLSVVMMIGWMAFAWFLLVGCDGREAEIVANVPGSSRSLEGQNVEYVVVRFEDAGFQNIRTIREEVTSLGWFNSDNSVINVSINGQTFNRSATFSNDVNVTITYRRLIEDMQEEHDEYEEIDETELAEIEENTITPIVVSFSEFSSLFFASGVLPNGELMPTGLMPGEVYTFEAEFRRDTFGQGNGFVMNNENHLIHLSDPNGDAEAIEITVSEDVVATWDDVMIAEFTVKIFEEHVRFQTGDERNFIMVQGLTLGDGTELGGTDKGNVAQ